MFECAAVENHVVCEILGLVKFASWTSSTSLTPWLSLTIFSDCGFVMSRWHELNHSILSSSLFFGSLLKE